MAQFIRGFISSFILFITVVLIYHQIEIVGLMDDGFFTLTRIFLGFFQWIYAFPLYLKIKKNIDNINTSRGFISASIIITLLNIGLFIWIFLDPSKFI